MMHRERANESQLMKRNKGLDLIPNRLHKRFLFDERHHAASILASDFPDEFNDILLCLDAFHLKKSSIMAPGGPLSSIPKAIDGFLVAREWERERRFDIKITADDKSSWESLSGTVRAFFASLLACA
jgi:hypothetical protein